jgi:hypothetical protein
VVRSVLSQVDPIDIAPIDIGGEVIDLGSDDEMGHGEESTIFEMREILARGNNRLNRFLAVSEKLMDEELVNTASPTAIEEPIGYQKSLSLVSRVATINLAAITLQMSHLPALLPDPKNEKAVNSASHAAYQELISRPEGPALASSVTSLDFADLTLGIDRFTALIEGLEDEVSVNRAGLAGIQEPISRPESVALAARFDSDE